MKSRSQSPTGLALPRLALPEIDEPGEIARYLLGDGMPGEFPYLNGAYREMYLEPLPSAIETGSYGKKKTPNGFGERRMARDKQEWRSDHERPNNRKNRLVFSQA